LTASDGGIADFAGAKKNAAVSGVLFERFL